MKCKIGVVAGLLIACILFLGLNYRQLYSAWAVKSEMKRLVNLAADAPDEFQNPAPIEDHFAGMLSTEFWKFSIINGGGKVSNESAWHATSMTYQKELAIQHQPDPGFSQENSNLAHRPAAEQYNNITLIGGSGFRPTPSYDVVLRFSLKVDKPFYGTSGVIFQPVGTIQQDGLIVKPFDMFGLSIVGDESFVQGMNGPLCYLALSSMPVEVTAFSVDAHIWHDYEIRLRWMSGTEWSGTVKVDDMPVCQISMPAFGPVEVHVWSDNALAIYKPRRWWEMGPFMDLKFQNGGDKQFLLRTIQIATETR